MVVVWSEATFLLNPQTFDLKKGPLYRDLTWISNVAFEKLGYTDVASNQVVIGASLPSSNRFTMFRPLKWS